MILDTQLDHLHAVEMPTPFPVGPITAYLADAPDEPLTLIDTGPRAPDARAALQAGLAALGYAPSDLARIVVTHAHVDHCGLAGDLVAASGAQVLTHPWNIPALVDCEDDRRRLTAFYAGLLRQAGVPAEIAKSVGWVTQGMKQFTTPVACALALEEGDTLRLAGRDWQVLHTPGHASGLICLYEPGSRTLLSADHLLADISSNPLAEPPPPGSTGRYRSLVEYRSSLRRVAAMDIARALPSHGPLIEDVAGLVGRRLHFHEIRLARVLDALRDGARTTWDVTHALFPGRSPIDTFLAVSEVIAHLDVLEMAGHIAGATEDDGMTVWTVTSDS